MVVEHVPRSCTYGLLRTTPQDFSLFLEKLPRRTSYEVSNVICCTRDNSSSFSCGAIFCITTIPKKYTGGWQWKDPWFWRWISRGSPGMCLPCKDFAAAFELMRTPPWSKTHLTSPAFTNMASVPPLFPVSCFVPSAYCSLSHREWPLRAGPCSCFQHWMTRTT